MYRISNVYVSCMYRICIVYVSYLIADLLQVCSSFTEGLSHILLYILHITATEAFPCAAVEEEDIVAIDAGYLVAVLVHGIPPGALLDTETAVSEHRRKLVGIGIQFASRTMVDVPIAGRA